MPISASRPRAALVSTALVVALAGGSVASNVLRDGDPGLEVHIDDGYRYFTEPHPFRWLAENGGVLTYLPDQQCLVLRHDPFPGLEETRNQPVRHELVIWPEGTTVDDEDGRVTVTVPDQGSFRLGDEIALGGGGLSDAGVTRIQSAYDVPDRCVAGGVFTAWEVSADIPKDPLRDRLLREYETRQKAAGSTD